MSSSITYKPDSVRIVINNPRTGEASGIITLTHRNDLDAPLGASHNCPWILEQVPAKLLLTDGELKALMSLAKKHMTCEHEPECEDGYAL